MWGALLVFLCRRFWIGVMDAFLECFYVPVIVKSVRGYHKRPSPRLGTEGIVIKLRSFVPAELSRLYSVSLDSASPMPLLGDS